MTALDLKHLYSRFLQGHAGKLHFAAHSHHFWPDVSREAQIEYWDDCAKMSDEKWNKIFSEIIPGAQKHVARLLKLKYPQQIAFAPNTHELATRILSLFLGKSSVSILTTSSEFHSWRRQILRISELPQVRVETISTEKCLQDKKAFISEIKSALKKGPDLFFLSQVFFDSGLALETQDLIEIEQSKLPSTIMVIDGYHGFGAIPLDLSPLEGKIFYLAGGYKYAQAGEGCSFVIIPRGEWRPAYTGWFAEYAQLSTPPGTQTGYSDDFMAFMGATQDPSGLYRFKAVWDLFEKQGLNLEAIHDHVKSLQKVFLENLPSSFNKDYSLKPLFEKNLNYHGHFLTFEANSEASAQAFQERLKAAEILIDRRGQRIRFGFGLYHTPSDVIGLCQRLQKLA